MHVGHSLNELGVREPPNPGKFISRPITIQIGPICARKHGFRCCSSGGHNDPCVKVGVESWTLLACIHVRSTAIHCTVVVRGLCGDGSKVHSIRVLRVQEEHKPRIRHVDGVADESPSSWYRGWLRWRFSARIQPDTDSCHCKHSPQHNSLLSLWLSRAARAKSCCVPLPATTKENAHDRSTLPR